MEVLGDISVAESVARRMCEVTTRSKDGVYTLVRKEDWVAVPTQNSCHLNKGDRERLAVTYADVRQDAIWAVAMEELLQEPRVYRVRATEEGFAEFSYRCGLFNYALCSQDLSSLVICTTDDYTVYAGSPEFVGRATGGSVQEMFEGFRAYCAEFRTASAKQYAWLEGVRLALLEDYPNAKPGDWVQFPRLNAPSASG
jgi:hypothetical protein